MAYLLDSNVFMEAKNRYYGFDFCPAFWDWLIAKNADGEVFSIEKVHQEIKTGDDELVAWVAKRGDSFFIEALPPVLTALRRVGDWVQRTYEPAASTKFMRGADCHLVAYALAGGHKVVTHEVSAPDSRTKIKIPDACRNFGVTCMSTFDMLRKEKARFVLGATL